MKCMYTALTGIVKLVSKKKKEILEIATCLECRRGPLCAEHFHCISLRPWKNPMRKALPGLWMGTPRLSRVNTARRWQDQDWSPVILLPAESGGAYFPFPCKHRHISNPYKYLPV